MHSKTEIIATLVACQRKLEELAKQEGFSNGSGHISIVATTGSPSTQVVFEKAYLRKRKHGQTPWLTTREICSF